MDASVAKQKSLRELHYSIKTINKVLYLIENFLIIFDLCLLLDDASMHLVVDSRNDTFKLQLDIFFNHSPLVRQLILVLSQRGKMLVHHLKQGSYLFVSVS